MASKSKVKVDTKEEKLEAEKVKEEKFKGEKVAREAKGDKIFKNPKHSALLSEIKLCKDQKEIAKKVKEAFGITQKLEIG